MSNGTVKLGEFGWTINALPHVALRLKRTFAKIGSRQHGDLKLSDTIDVARDLQWFMQRFPMEISDLDRVHLELKANMHRERESIVQRIMSNQIEPRAFVMELPPRDYQRQAAELLLASGALLCCDELGIGKTVTAIATLTEPATRPALVVVQSSLQIQWQRQLRKFAPQLYSHILTSGTPYDLLNIKMTREERARFGQQRRMPDVLISTSAKLSGWAETFAEITKSVVIDEVQEFRRGIETKKGAAMAHIRARLSYALGLTATPVYNYGSEIFHIVDILKPGALGTKGEFMEEWVGLADPGADAKKGKVKNAKALGAFLRSEGLMIRRTRKEVRLELPPVTRIVHQVDADEKPLADVKEAAVALARVVLSETALEPHARMEAAQELSWRLRQATGIAKAPHVAAFVRMIAETEKKVVLFGWHREVYSIWLHLLADLRPLLFTGSETAKQKDAAFQEFVEGKARLLIVSLRAGAGLDGLQEVCSTCVFGELDWSPGVHEQCEGRLDRAAQKRPVCAFYMTCDSGSDPVVEDVLRDKLEQLRSIRDPDAELFEHLQADDNRVKKLAEYYLTHVA